MLLKSVVQDKGCCINSPRLWSQPKKTFLSSNCILQNDFKADSKAEVNLKLDIFRRILN